MANPRTISSSSNAAAVKSYIFKNVSGEVIPKFAAMQVVGDPKFWKDFVADPKNDDVSKAFKKINDISTTDQFDNGMQLWCDKPSAATELLQDPSIMAFNGDSEVAVDGGGRCFYGEYPARAMISSVPSLQFSYAALAGSWHLTRKYGRFGAFRAFCDTQQRVKQKVNSVERKLWVANITDYSALRWKPAVNGGFALDANDASQMTVINDLFSIYNGETFQDNIAFRRVPTLTLSVNSPYSFLVNAYVRVKEPPSNINRIPFKFGMIPYSNDDSDRFVSESYPFTGENYPWPVFYLQKYKRVGGVIIPLAVDEVPTTGTEVRWARTKVVYVDRLIVTKAPAKIAIKQVLSPYVQSTGDFSSVMEYERQFVIDSNTLYAEFGGGDYNTPSATYDLPEVEDSVGPKHQRAYQYFSPSEPWVSV